MLIIPCTGYEWRKQRVNVHAARLIATSLSVMLLMSTLLMRRLRRLHAKHRLSDNLRSPRLRRRSVCLWRRSYGPNSPRPCRADPDDTRDLRDVGLWRTVMFTVRRRAVSDARFSIGRTWRRFQVPRQVAVTDRFSISVTNVYFICPLPDICAI